MENDMAIQKIKLKTGTVYQKEENGIYYFRYQVNGARKAISLKTRNKQQAIKEAEKHIPLIQATSSEVIAAHVQHARNLVKQEKICCFRKHGKFMKKVLNVQLLILSVKRWRINQLLLNLYLGSIILLHSCEISRKKLLCVMLIICVKKILRFQLITVN